MTYPLTVGGRTFTVGPRTKADWKAMLPAYLRLCGTDEPSPDLLRRVVESDDGRRVLLTHMLRKDDPKVTPAWVKAHTADPNTLRELFDHMCHIEYGHTTPGAA